MPRSTRHGLFGLRLAPSLHLGHYVGNIQPAMAAMSEGADIYVILADVLTITSGRWDGVTRENMLAMMADCIAFGLNGENVKFVIQSRLSEQCSALQSIVASQFTFGQLVKIQPIKGLVEQSPQSASFAEISFPLIQCTEMISLGIEELYSNIDNLGIVSLAKRVSLRLGKKLGLSLPAARLVHGLVPYLKGTDGRKMSYGNGNALSIADSPASILERVVRIRTDRGATHESGSDADHSLLFLYGSLAGLTLEDASAIQKDYQANRVTSLGIKKLVASQIAKWLEPIQRVRKELLINNSARLWERLNDETECAASSARQNCNMLMKPWIIR